MKQKIAWEPWGKYIEEIVKHGRRRRRICGIDMVDLAEEYGTPLYVLFQPVIEENYRRYQVLGSIYDHYLVCYAVKANTTFALINILAECGAGADVASEYELWFALDAGVPAEKIRANGNCKSERFLAECVQRGIIVNIDPEDELYLISDIARELGKEAKINLRLSGFPLENITAANIFTSGKWSKFGIDLSRVRDVLRKLTQLNYINLQGLMVHLGSQITRLNAYTQVLGMLIKLAEEAISLGFDIKEIDLGGGFGISYLARERWEQIKAQIKADQDFTWGNEPIGYEYDFASRGLIWQGEELYSCFTPDSFLNDLLSGVYSSNPAKSFKQGLEEIGSPLFVLEPGRGIVGNAGLTIFRVGHVGTTSGGENIVHVDGGVNLHGQNIIIPEQLHRMEIANNLGQGEPFNTFVAGNLCYTGDLLVRIKTTLERTPEKGDYLIFYDTGAYSDFFASNANSFPRPAKVMITRDRRPRLVVKREEYADIFSRDMDWGKEPQSLPPH